MIRSRTLALLFCAAGVPPFEMTAQTMMMGGNVVFFPPATPIYGAAIEERPSTGARIYGGRRLYAPDGLADFAGEHFYPALSTRLYLLELPAKLEARVHAYRAKRWEQVNALLNQFVIAHDLAPEERELRLRDFARAQAPELAALEAEAEEIMQLLISDGLRNRIDWNTDRRWKLGTIKAGANGADAEAEFQVVRAAVHYQKGLLPQQRGLLREVATELQVTARKARGLPGARLESDAMFFSPETTRLRLPADLLPEVRDKIAAYNGEKAALKRELRELVVAQEGAKASERVKAFEALADRQWTRLGDLERLAEEIRTHLAPRLEAAPPPPPPWIPAGLMEAIRSYNEDRDAYFGEMRHRMDLAAANVERPDSNVSSDERIQRQREWAAAQDEARKMAARQFQEQHIDRFRLLEQRYKMIRQTLSVVAEKQVDRKTGRALDADTLLRQYGASMEAFNTFGREAAIYQNYRIAMLEPGLSPEQRRLLLSYAIVGLAQPLPYGEFIPPKSAKQPFPSS